MPLYRYRCEACAHTFSVLDSLDSAAVRTCEECGAPRAHRIPARVGVHYKGSGFYTTTYRRSRESSDTDTRESSDTANTSSST